MISLKSLTNSIRIKISSPSKRAEIIKEVFNIKMGTECEFYGNISFGSEPYLISIGSDVRVTANVNFVTHDGGMWVLRKSGLLENADKFGCITVGNNVHRGINAIIMPNITIGDNVVIGAGSVVTRNIPSNCYSSWDSSKGHQIYR
jgi:acetyltransferase-like isoleucine patch superfamily enzyme